jgi:hypothetical protein
MTALQCLEDPVASVDPASRAAAPARASASDAKVNVFISYASPDREIAKTLYEELCEVDRNRVSCFMDTRTLEAGEEWLKQLKDALRKADWLVCIYTGEQSEFCGFEVGIFAETNGAMRQAGADPRIVCLHNVEEIPGIFKPYQSRLITTFSDMPATAQRDEANFYQGQPVAKFLSDFYKYHNLYTVRDAADGARQQQKLGQQAKRISEAFALARQREIKSSTPIQLGIEVRMTVPEGSTPQAIPADAEVSGTFQSFGLFNLRPSMQNEQLPRTSWGKLRAACTGPFSMEVPWMDKLEHEMILAANERTGGAPEATFKSGEKVYRAILSRHVSYYSGVQQFSILFVETLPRQFLGRKNTSMLLAGLVLASRFRFAYLEDKDEVFNNKFGDRLSDERFEIGCRQLKYDLEQMSHEAADFGLLDPTTFIQSFGAENKAEAESFMINWAEMEKRLYAGLPSPTIRVTSKNRREIKDAVQEFMNSIELENEKFIVTAIDVFRSEIVASFPKRARHA